MCCKIFKIHPRSPCQPASQAQILLYIWVIYSFLAVYLNMLLTHCARPTDTSVLVRPLKASDKNLQSINLVIEHIHTIFCQSKDSLGHWTWLWLWWSPDPLSGATMRFTFLVCLENNKCPLLLNTHFPLGWIQISTLWICALRPCRLQSYILCMFTVMMLSLRRCKTAGLC